MQPARAPAAPLAHSRCPRSRRTPPERQPHLAPSVVARGVHVDDCVAVPRFSQGRRQAPDRPAGSASVRDGCLSPFPIRASACCPCGPFGVSFPSVCE
eukprot:scaffold9673_cov112-Isochrysis_galbana.AAC.2